MLGAIAGGNKVEVVEIHTVLSSCHNSNKQYHSPFHINIYLNANKQNALFDKAVVGRWW